LDRKTIGIWVAAGALYLLGLIIIPAFRSTYNLVSILRSVSFIGILAVGQTVVVLLRGFDLSQTAVAPLAGLAAAWLVEYGGQGAGTAAAAACAIGLGAGAFNGMIVAYAGLSGFITTLCSYSLFVGLGLLVHPGGITNVNDSGFLWLGNAKLGPIPVSVIFLFGVVATVAFFLGRTPWGRGVYAAGSNPVAARAYGINVRKVVVSGYVVSGLTAGLAGFLLASWFGEALEGTPTIGLGQGMLESIGAVLVGGIALAGGRGSVIATAGGVFLIGELSNLLSITGASETVIQLSKGAVIVLAACFYSDGLAVLRDKLGDGQLARAIPFRAGAVRRTETRGQ
jgi:ribose/xylose/arabinose/galactoside ABC-type transport system permease subunit